MSQGPIYLFNIFNIFGRCTLLSDFPFWCCRTWAGSSVIFCGRDKQRNIFHFPACMWITMQWRHVWFKAC